MPQWAPAFLILMLLCSAAGCTGDDPVQEEAVRGAVREYNERLVEGYRRRDMSVLNGIATKDQAFTEYYHMAAVGETGATLLSTQTVLTFLEVRLSEAGTASVLTEEEWVFSQVASDGVLLRPEGRVTYALTYELVERDGGWLVNWVFETADPRRPPEERSAEASGYPAPVGR